MTHQLIIPGLFCVIPCTDEFKLVDLRTVSFDVPPQEVCAHAHAAFACFCLFTVVVVLEGKERIFILFYNFFPFDSFSFCLTEIRSVQGKLFV